MDYPIPSAKVKALRRSFDEGLLENIPLARYTSAHIGGPADFLIVVSSSDQLANAARTLWDMEIAFRVLGGGSNVLVADSGVRGVVMLNRANEFRFWEAAHGLRLEAESGAMLANIARRAVEKGWTGLEWAVSIPGTLGGAITENAGAYNGDMAGVLEVADILQRNGDVEHWPVDRLEYAYRDSWLKRHPGQAVVLRATLRMEPATLEETNAKMGEFVAQRKLTQPAGASMGSMFKNPPGDYAGRLIEAAGLKGTSSGGAQISPRHGNYFINLGDATAADVWSLIQIAREQVANQFGVALELEVELLGDWESMKSNAVQTQGGGAA
ncbi:MAG: UDP-N-acetylmuramate dehydrogenase [Anaerolineales bacterium]